MSKSSYLLGVIVLLPLSVLTYGWGMAVLWAWFVAPVFGLPTLTIPQAYGLSLAMGLLTATHRQSDTASNDEERLEQFTALAGRALLGPPMLVGIACGLRLFM